MTREEALNILMKMRAWREWGKEQKEEERPEMPEQKEVDEAFDVCIKLLQEQLPFSSDIDEAAEKYCSANTPLGATCRACFRDGAEWMAGQGYTFETIMQEDDVDELVPTCPDMYNHGYSCSDKVIVQIRKKQ